MTLESTRNAVDIATDPRGCVLLIDDSEAMTRALGAVLRQAGFNTHACLTGGDAMAYAAKGLPISAAVVDIHLPDVSGLAVAKSLRDRFGGHIPIVVVSGDTSMENLNALHGAGATYFFSKPLQPRQLVHRLREWLDAGAQPS